MRGRDVVGVLSDRDAGGRAGSNLRAQLRVRDLMTTDVATATPDITVRKAANLMRGRTIGCLPVLNRGKLVGIVTTSDLLELIGRGRERPTRPERRVLHHRVPHRKVHRGAGLW
jgi:acetoin utilization protein AcuB